MQQTKKGFFKRIILKPSLIIIMLVFAIIIYPLIKITEEKSDKEELINE